MLILFNSGTWLSTINNKAKLYTAVVTITCTVILPAISMFFLKKKNWISDYELKDRQEARIPLMLQSFFTLLAAFILQKATAPLIMALFLNGVSIFLLVGAAISIKWNISLHMAGLGGLFGLALATTLQWMLDLRLIIGALILAIAFTASAQLNLQKHNPLQVYLGILLGFVSIFSLIYLI